MLSNATFSGKTFLIEIIPDRPRPRVNEPQISIFAPISRGRHLGDTDSVTPNEKIVSKYPSVCMSHLFPSAVTEEQKFLRQWQWLDY